MLSLKKKRLCASPGENAKPICQKGQSSAQCDPDSLFVQWVTTWICF